MKILRVFAGVGLLALSMTACSVEPEGAANYENDVDAPMAGPDSALVSPEEDNKSTFAVDVDTASYEVARDNIFDGQLPDPDMVRPEEFVNSFAQDYDEPEDDGFTVSGDGMFTPSWYADSEEPTHIMRVGLQTKTEPASERKDARLTFVIDTSGSMAGHITIIQDSLHLLIDELSSRDAVAIVTYADEGDILIPMTPVTDKTMLHAAIDDLTIDGGTNLEGGFVTGYEVATDGFDESAVNRVILLSDGMANIGDTKDAPILKKAREKAAAGIALLCVGVGKQYGDELMEQLADNGDGFAVFFSTATQARKLFVEQLPATLAVRAKDAKVQVTFNVDTVKNYRLIGFDNRAIADDDFTNDSVDGGEVGPGHNVTALYAVTLKDDASGTVATADVRWLHPDTLKASQESTTITVDDISVDSTDASDWLNIDVIAACFAENLRGDSRVQQVELLELSRVAADLGDATGDDSVTELATLIANADDLKS